jgi:hypothetical protein
MTALHRVRADEFHRRGNLWVPLIRTENGELKEVQAVAQPGGQEAFIAMTEREGLFAGPRGTGKTQMLGTTFLQYVGSGYGAAWKGIMLRESLTGFTEVERLLQDLILPIWGSSAQYNINKHTWTFSSSETLRLAHFADMSDYGSLIGTSWSWIGWEEVTQFATELYYKQMMATNRSAMAGIPLMVRSTTNPGGPGHTWVKMRFDPPPEPKEGYIIGPRIVVDGIDRRAICSTLIENQRLLIADPNYAAMIRASAKDAAQEEAWLNGSWNIAAGGLFEAAFYEAAEHFIVPEVPASSIPPSWQITRGFDWGESKPFGCLWFAISDGTPIKLTDRTLRFLKGDALVFDELYGCQEGRPNEGLGWTIAEIKRAIIERELESGLRVQLPDGKWQHRARGGVADSAIFVPQANRDSAESFADEFERQTRINGAWHRGIRWEPAEKPAGSRVKGWVNIRGRLYATMPTRDSPGLFISKNCQHTLRTLKDLPRDKRNNDDCPDMAEDHLADVIRYVLGKKHEPSVRFQRRWYA